MTTPAESNTMTTLQLGDFDWQKWRPAWDLPADATYLNHGSFGLAPRAVLEARLRYVAQMQRNPMDFYVRQCSFLLDAAAGRLAAFVGCSAEDLAFVPNATAGVNIVVASTNLRPGDEVLVTDHEYGAVIRIWEHACRRAQARLVTAQLPPAWETADKVVAAVMARVTPATRVLVMSHVTSQSATCLPVRALTHAARERDITVCIDGPHAIATVPLDLSDLDCDFYAASCHKWLSAPLGTGFLYVHPRQQSHVRPTLISWGRTPPGQAASWRDEFRWPGTFDPSSYLAVSDAIAFLEQVGLEDFRAQTQMLASYAAQRLQDRVGAAMPYGQDLTWRGPMVTLALPQEYNVPHAADQHPLQLALWNQDRIEAPVFQWQDTTCLRVSCHLYNTPEEIDRLADAVAAKR